MKAPEEHGLAHLWALWPVFTAYVLSYAYVAIYWVNHHRLFAHASRITNDLLWANIALLFTLSLVPFATAYLGEQHFSHDATLVYMCVMMLPSFAYVWLQSVIRRTGRQDEAAQAYHHRTLRKGRSPQPSISAASLSPSPPPGPASPAPRWWRCCGSCPKARSTRCSGSEAPPGRPASPPSGDGQVHQKGDCTRTRFG